MACLLCSKVRMAEVVLLTAGKLHVFLCDIEGIFWVSEFLLSNVPARRSCLPSEDDPISTLAPEMQKVTDAAILHSA